MADKKLIAVVGATGAQGGGLVRAILADKDSRFAARAITRNVNSDKAKALAAAGAEVVAADLDDEASLERAFAGAYGAFCVTNFWEHFSPEKEHGPGQQHGPRRQGRRRAARHLVDARGHAQVRAARRRPHADAAGASTRCRTSTARARPTSSSATRGVPTTFLLTVVLLGQPHLLRRRARSAGPTAARPDVTHGRQEAAGHRGRGHRQVRLRHLQAGQELIGKTVGIAGEHLTGEEMAAELSRGARPGGRATPTCRPRSTAASASPAPTTWATCSSSSATSTNTVGNARSIDFSRSLNPELQICRAVARGQREGNPTRLTCASARARGIVRHAVVGRCSRLVDQAQAAEFGRSPAVSCAHEGGERTVAITVARLCVAAHDSMRLSRARATDPAMRPRHETPRRSRPGRPHQTSDSRRLASVGRHVRIRR